MSMSMIESIRMSLAGHAPKYIKDDGQIHRFSTKDRSGDLDGWYVSHGKVGTFGCWRNQLTQGWTASGEITEEDRRTFERDKQKAKDDQAQKHEEARNVAAAIWEASSEDATGHPYLAKKGIGRYWCKMISSERAMELCPSLSTALAGNLLVIPLRIGGVLHSLQFIDESGEKRPLTGGRKKGCYHIIGNAEGSKYLLLAEGFATAVSIHQAMNMPVAFCVDAGNLPEVSAHFAEKVIVVCADNDEAGIKAAEKCKAQVTAIAPISAKGNDFNDLGDRDKIKAVISKAIKDYEGRDPFPDLHQMPQFVVLDDWMEYRPYDDMDEQGGWIKSHAKTLKAHPGVYWCYIPKGKNPKPVNQYLCGPIHVDAITADKEGNHSGRVLRMRTITGSWREWAMPADPYLSATGDSLAMRLREMNMDVSTTGHAHLSRFVQEQRPARQLVAATKTGWCGKAYVTDNGIYGPDKESIVIQSATSGFDKRFSRRGTLDDWRDKVASMAIGNNLLTLAISAAFAGPLLKMAGIQGGGIHFFGDSSTGKTKLLQAACSVWGGDKYKRSWNMTVNGLETACESANDCLLAMDEMAQSGGWKLGEMIYAIGNGEGRTRLSQTAQPIKPKSWRTFVLSTGERTASTLSKTDLHAGAMVRLIDIHVNRRYGAWENLKQHPSGAAFSDELDANASLYHGTAGPAFVEQLIAKNPDVSSMLGDVDLGDTETGQAGRIKRSLQVVALAGELAAEFGIVSWLPGASIDAAKDALRSWVDLNSPEYDSPSGSIEQSSLIQRVHEYISQHRDGSFTHRQPSGHVSGDVAVQNRRGWFDADMDGSRIYYLTPFAFKEMLEGFDRKPSIAALTKAGILTPGSNRNDILIKVCNEPVRAYQIKI